MALLRGVVGFFTFFAAFALKRSGEPAWKVETTYAPTVVEYGSIGFPSLADPGPPSNGFTGS